MVKGHSFALCLWQSKPPVCFQNHNLFCPRFQHKSSDSLMWRIHCYVSAAQTSKSAVGRNYPCCQCAIKTMTYFGNYLIRTCLLFVHHLPVAAQTSPNQPVSHTSFAGSLSVEYLPSGLLHQIRYAFEK